MTESAGAVGWEATTTDKAVLVTLSGAWVARDGAGADHEAPRQILGGGGVQSLSFDAGRLDHWDSALLVFLSALRDICRHDDIAFDEAGLPPAARRLLALVPDIASGEAASALHHSLVDEVGLSTIAAWRQVMEIVAFVGEAILRGLAAFGGRARMRAADLLTCAQEAGIDALPIVAIVNFLVGGILAFVGAIQLRRFGADIYVANLVGIAVVREMAPLMTAIVMSGRTGGAYAAHIATMEGNEEVDALRVIGIPVFDYLVLPRLGALTLSMPLLYLYASAVGVFGGFLVSAATLNVNSEAFFHQLHAALSLTQLLFGLIKSLTFGAFIALVGCRVGLQAGRSAADVGHAATSAVVIGIVGVIALDAVFAVCANALHF